jgi:hypothetical protein
MFMIGYIALGLQPVQHEYNRGYALNLMVTTVLTIGGVIYCYVKNGGNSGYDFIQKSIVLGWVVAIRITLIFIPIALIISLSIEKKLGNTLGAFSWITIVRNIVLIAIFNQRLGRHLKDTSKQTTNHARDNIYQLSDQ